MNFFKKLFRCSKKAEKDENKITETEKDCSQELDDDSLSHVSAAGVIESTKKKPEGDKKPNLRLR